MKDSIIVSVTELRSLLQDIRRSGADYVELSISEAEEYDGDILPAELSLSACKRATPDTWLDFDPIDAVENENELHEKSLAAIHTNIF